MDAYKLRPVDPEEEEQQNQNNNDDDDEEYDPYHNDPWNDWDQDDGGGW